jgi:hypothetical protein
VDLPDLARREGESIAEYQLRLEKELIPLARIRWEDRAVRSRERRKWRRDVVKDATAAALGTIAGGVVLIGLAGLVGILDDVPGVGFAIVSAVALVLVLAALLLLRRMPQSVEDEAADMAERLANLEIRMEVWQRVAETNPLLSGKTLFDDP